MQSKRNKQYKSNGTNRYQVRRVQSMVPPHPPEKGGLQRTRIIRHSFSRDTLEASIRHAVFRATLSASSILKSLNGL